MAQFAGVKSFFISLHSFLFICVSPLCKLASDFRPLVHVSHEKKSPKAIRLLNFFWVGLFFQIVSRGRGARTPIYGFGDRCSTIELFPYVLFLLSVPRTDIIISQPVISVNNYFNFFQSFFKKSNYMFFSVFLYSNDSWKTNHCLHILLKKECALAHSRAERGRLRHVSSSRECASLAR